MTILQDLEAVQKESARLFEELEDTILNLPDNPRIKRLGTNSFTISSKNLGTTNWTPLYHDFKASYQHIMEWLKKKDITKVRDALLSVIEKGYIRETYNRQDFHPDVIEHLKTILSQGSGDDI